MHIDDKWVYNPKRRSTASLKARPKTQEKNEATTKVIRRSFAKENKNKISQEEKTKFIEFYQEGIEKVMSFRETRGNDNYDELASTIGLNELQYQPAT